MIDQLFMKDLAFDLAPPLEPVEQPATLLAAGPATSDVGQVTVQGYNEAKPSGVRVGRAGISPEQSAKAGGLDRPLVALLDTLAGALQGGVVEGLALPGNIRSILDVINKEGAQKYLGDPFFPTTEQLKEKLPAVIPQGVANQVDREHTAKMASEIGAFLPAPGIPEAAVQGAKMVGKAIKATKGLPVGMSTQAVGEGVDQLGFYSAAKQAVDAIQQPKGTGDQFLKQIEKTPGVKPDEIKWTGLDEFLKSKKSVTKAEVQEYLDKNRVEVKEVKLGEPDEGEIQALLNDEMGQGMTRQDAIDYLANDEGSLAPKFSKYTLPGGENYREVLLTLPTNMSEYNKFSEGLTAKYGPGGFANLPLTDVERARLEKFYANEEKQPFKSGHFEQPNILAHLRVNDRVDADGKKVLFVEEVQSDWHQAGRKKGYVDNSIPRYTIQEDQYGVFRVKDMNNQAFEPIVDGDRLSGFMSKEAAENAVQANLSRLPKAKDGAVPDAPFKTTWSELAMKRAIQLASEGGYDRIAFTTGKTQAERFDLSKQIDNIQFNPTTNALFAEDKFGKTVIDETVNPNELDEYVGKEVAQKLLSENSIIARKKDGTPYLHEVSGVDLQVGGEGMKGFYDDILPKFLNKYAKKWDAKAGMTEIATEPTRGAGGMPSMYPEKVPVHYIDITPKMRESVVTKGQPMFAIGAGGAGAAATQQEDNK